MRRYFYIQYDDKGDLVANECNRAFYDKMRAHGRRLKNAGLGKMRNICAGWNQAIIIY